MTTLILASLLFAAGCGGGAATRRTSPTAAKQTLPPRRLPSANPPPATRRDCLPRPSACGYPDPSNTGVPPGTSLRAYEGDLRISTPGSVIADLAVNGSVEITASHVTLKDSEVTSSGGTAHAVWIGPGARDVTIEDSTLRGGDAAARAIQYAVQNSGDASNRGLRLNMYYCTECWAGPGTIEDSYANTNAVMAGAHYEPIYYGGGGGLLVVDHDTLLNPEDQTADVFTKTDFGNVDTVTITDNLMAGGGYMIYGGLGGAGTVNGPVTVTGNRFARCLTRPILDRGGGHFCLRGPDVHGYWPNGGHYGVSGDFNDAVTTWKGNYWDDSGAAVANPS